MVRRIRFAGEDSVESSEQSNKPLPEDASTTIKTTRRVHFIGEDYVESNEQTKKSLPQDHCAISTDSEESDTEQATNTATFSRHQKEPKSKQHLTGRPISNLRLRLDRQRKQEGRAGHPLLRQSTRRRRAPAPPSLPPSGTHAYSLLMPGTASSPIPIPGRSACHPFNGRNQVLNYTCLADGLPPAEQAYKLPNGSGYDKKGEGIAWVPWQIDPAVSQWEFMTDQRFREEYERQQYQLRFELATELGWLRNSD